MWVFFLQVHKAYEYLQQSHEVDLPDRRYVVRVNRAGGQASGRGIYLREPQQSQFRTSHMVDVTPTLHEVLQP